MESLRYSLFAVAVLLVPQAASRFEREARAAAKVESENVVRTYDAGEQHGVHYLAMECVEGQDLATYVRGNGPLPLPQAIACTIQAARGLQAAHDANIIHRDVKPHNLLLAAPHSRAGREVEGATVKLLDLGLARIAGDAATLERTNSTVTSDGQIMGTLDYISPEQIVDTHAADARSDICSLGCTFYLLLTGRPPYEGNYPIQKIDARRSAPIPKVAITKVAITLRRDEPLASSLSTSDQPPTAATPTPEAHHAERL